MLDLLIDLNWILDTVLNDLYLVVSFSFWIN